VVGASVVAGDVVAVVVGLVAAVLALSEPHETPTMPRAAIAVSRSRGVLRMSAMLVMQ